MERRISPSKVSEMILPVVSTEAWPDTKISSPTRVAGLKGRCETGVSEDFGYSIIGASPAWCVSTTLLRGAPGRIEREHRAAHAAIGQLREVARAGAWRCD